MCDATRDTGLPSRGHCVLSSGLMISAIGELGDVYQILDHGKRRIALSVGLGNGWARLAKRGKSLFLLTPAVTLDRVDRRVQCECEGGPVVVGESGHVNVGSAFVLDDVPAEIEQIIVPVVDDYVEWQCKIRATGSLEPGLVSRTLARVSLVGAAAPAYLAAHGTPGSPRELRQHRCLMGFDQQERAQTHWNILGKKTAIAGAAFSNDPHLVLRFALRGLGIAFLPATLVSGALARGELVAVLPKQLRLQGSVSVVYVERKLMPPQVRAFVDWLIERAPTALSQPSAAGS